MKGTRTAGKNVTSGVRKVERKVGLSTRPTVNRDPLTGQKGSHPVGTGIGAAGGASTGALIGAVGGPVGVAVGAVVGGIAGAVVGKNAAEVMDPTDPEAREKE